MTGRRVAWVLFGLHAGLILFSTAAMLTVLAGWHLAAALGVGAAAGALTACAVGFPALRVKGLMLVVAPDPVVAGWCSEPIEIGVPGFVLTPPVLRRDAIPVITDPAEAANAARAQAEEFRRRETDRARGDADAFLDRAKKEIAMEEARVRDALRREVVDLAMEVSSKVLERAVGSEDDRRLADRLVGEVRAKRPGAARN